MSKYNCKDGLNTLISTVDPSSAEKIVLAYRGYTCSACSNLSTCEAFKKSTVLLQEIAKARQQTH